MRLLLASALVALVGLAAGTPLAAQARDLKNAAAAITASCTTRSTGPRGRNLCRS